MTDKNINEAVGGIKRCVAKGRLRDAFSLLKGLSEKLMAWEVTSAIISLENAYRYMLDYASKGIVDPGRHEMYISMCSQIVTYADQLSRRWSRRESPDLYFGTLRNESIPGTATISDLIDGYTKMENDFSLFGLVTDENSEIQLSAKRKDMELIEKRLFDRIWVSFPLHKESSETIKNVLTTDRHSKELKYIVLCALILGELKYHDEERLILLMDAYASSSDSTLAMSALVGLLLGLYAHSSRSLSAKVHEQLLAIKDCPSWRSDVKAAFMEFIATKDTERITRKLQNEVIPQVLKLRPDISKKFNVEDGVSIENLEENPEWQEILEKNGVTDKLKELSELQEEGADVFMGAFSQLKSFPFFNDIVNWFRLFDSAHSSLRKDKEGGDERIMEMLAVAPMLCNSDKYSFALSVMSMPEPQRRMMTAQLEAQSSHIAQLGMITEVTAPIARKLAAKMFIQDLYRFFKLFRRKGEFKDPFMLDFNPVEVDCLKSELYDSDTLQVAGEFYFKRHYWKEAAGNFAELLDLVPPSALIFQKLGYCYQKLGEVAKALDCYEQAELINAENHWTLRRIASCHRLLGNLKKSLDYFFRIEKFYPDDVNLAMTIGHTLLESGREKEAVDYYYKADYLDSSSSRAWRPLAWGLFKLKDFKNSRKYYDKILAGKPIPEDYLNSGHLALAQGDFKDATNFYNLYAELNPAGVDGLVKAIETDRGALSQVGVDDAVIPLILDSILYSITND